jgi:hypothetical protein
VLEEFYSYAALLRMDHVTTKLFRAIIFEELDSYLYAALLRMNQMANKKIFSHFSSLVLELWNSYAAL